MTLASDPPGDPAQARATLGGAAITGDTTWNGTWTTLPESHAGIGLGVQAATAAVVRIRY